MRPSPDFFTGHALYETLLVEAGRIAFGPQHFARLRASAREAGFADPPGDASLVSEIEAEVAAGPDAMRVNLRLDASGLRIASRRVDPDLPGLRDAGVAAITVEIEGADRASATHKWVSRGVLEVAQARARDAGAHEAILVAADRCILEGATSNVFCVSASGLRTPPADSRILPGVTRAQVCSLDPTVIESPLGIGELRAAREIFLTSAVRMIVPVVSLDGCPVGDGTPGPVTRSLATRLWTKAFGETP